MTALRAPGVDLEREDDEARCVCGHVVSDHLAGADDQTPCDVPLCRCADFLVPF